MQRERGGRDIFDAANAFRSFGSFGGGFGSQIRIPGFNHGRDPFDDPFFTQPFESIFDQKPTTREVQQANRAKDIMIEELSSDNEGGIGGEENDGEGRKAISDSSKEPYVQHPDDDDDDDDTGRKIKNSPARTASKRPQSLTRNFSYQTSKVTYGGVDGAYYTNSKTKRIGTDGVMLEEMKEADKTTGQATHKISRGIHDKGHSVTRKLNSDGKVDSMQTLHNLDEDELSGFEKAWKDNNSGKLPFWKNAYDADGSKGSSSDTGTGETMGGWLLPSLQGRTAGDSPVDNETMTRSGGKPNKIVRINIQ